MSTNNLLRMTTCTASDKVVKYVERQTKIMLDDIDAQLFTVHDWMSADEAILEVNIWDGNSLVRGNVQ
jgi:uncharacterized protein (DUF2164 family)